MYAFCKLVFFFLLPYLERDNRILIFHNSLLSLFISSHFRVVHMEPRIAMTWSTILRDQNHEVSFLEQTVIILSC